MAPAVAIISHASSMWLTSVHLGSWRLLQSSMTPTMCSQSLVEIKSGCLHALRHPCRGQSRTPPRLVRQCAKPFEHVTANTDVSGAGSSDECKRNGLGPLVLRARLPARRFRFSEARGSRQAEPVPRRHCQCPAQYRLDSALTCLPHCSSRGPHQPPLSSPHCQDSTLTSHRLDLFQGVSWNVELSTVSLL